MKTNAVDCIFHKMKFTSASTGKTLNLRQKSDKVEFEKNKQSTVSLIHVCMLGHPSGLAAEALLQSTFIKSHVHKNSHTFSVSDSTKE